jgi:uncharacterized membrane protein
MPAQAGVCSSCGAAAARNYPMGSFSDAWKILVSSPFDFIVATLIVSTLSGVVSSVTNAFIDIPSKAIAQALCRVSDAAVYAAVIIVVVSSLLNFLITIVILAPIYCGYSTYMLRKIRGERPDFSVLFSGFTQFLFTSAMAGLCFSLASGLGFSLCVLPGLIVSALSMFMYFVIADGETSVSGVFSRSASLFTRNFGINLLFFIVAGLIGISGILACCIGVLFTAPLSYIAIALVYNHLSGGAAGALTGNAASAPGDGPASPTSGEFNF